MGALTECLMVRGALQWVGRYCVGAGGVMGGVGGRFGWWRMGGGGGVGGGWVGGGWGAVVGCGWGGGGVGGGAGVSGGGW
jgi:uncharacterized protein